MDNKARHTSAIEGLFRAGRFADILRMSATPLDRSALNTEDRLLAARAMLHAGDGTGAESIAQAVNEPHAHALLRSRCELILALAAKRAGDLATARHRMQHAIHLAREAGHLEHQAWCQVSLFRLLAEGELEELISAV